MNPTLPSSPLSSIESEEMVTLSPIHVIRLRATSATQRGTLKPEQRRAIDVFLEHLEKRAGKLSKESLRKGDRRESIIRSGEVTFFAFHVTVSDLPVGNGWCWSQTRAKEELRLVESGTKTRFWKVISRANSPESVELPHYKVWLFQMSDPLVPPFSMVWCEKGLATEYTNPLSIAFEPVVVALPSFKDLFP